MFEDFKIEKNIPIPKSTKTRTGLWKHLAENMNVGDSVFLKNPPKNPQGKLAVLTRLYAYKPKRFTCQIEGEGARLWRTE